MKIEAGKYYRTRDGRKVGPMIEENPRRSDWPFDVKAEDRPFDICLWKDDGFCDESNSFDLIAEWTDTPAADTPVLWRDMTPAEKGALLLAHHEGKEVQGTRIDIPDDWQCMAIGLSDYAYRVKPADPVVETVTLYGAAQYRWKFNPTMVGDTHRITFNLIDGKPDVASIKMEEL